MSVPQNAPDIPFEDVVRCIVSDYEWIPPGMAGFAWALARMPPHTDRKQATKNALLLGYGEAALLEAAHVWPDAEQMGLP